VRLEELAASVRGAAIGSGGTAEIRRVVYDSRQAEPGDLFVAVRGLHVDGHDFAASAAAHGAAVAVERAVALPPRTAWLQVPDTRLGLAELAAALNGRPARRMTMIGITGSSGKSTSTHMIAHTLELAGRPTGFLSTVTIRAGGRILDNPSGRTTMESSDVQCWLGRIAGGGAEVAIVEATSHALDQARVGACEFDVVAVTNVGSDHLDYHHTRERYLRAKARLIELCAEAADKGIPKTAVLNRDDSSFAELVRYPIPRRLTFGIDGEADVRAFDLVPLEDGGTCFRLHAAGRDATVGLRHAGRYNVYNALCAAACCLAVGLPIEAVAAGLSTFAGVRGRLEPVEMGQPFRVYVDFASTAHELQTVLPQLRQALSGRLLVVVGPTGRSDHDRPRMGRAVAQNSDYFIITTDDPVQEDPAELAAEMERGMEGRRRGVDYEVILDRRAAIRRALEVARPGDSVVLAGKGHEQTMILAGGPFPWDDRSEAEAALRDMGFGQQDA
jgi:UDP-N-acetylmuramoyl-L-alanyl-D-glutamate--2,6-diaminopimelate ligase